jgi:hypothetical protein
MAFAKSLQHIKAQLRLEMPADPPYRHQRLKSDDPRLLTAQRLHARVYVRLHFIEPGDVAANGAMHLQADPHQAHADYFVVVDAHDQDKVLVTARQIRVEQTHYDLPVLGKARLSRRARRQLLGLSPEQLVEISGLVKDDGVPTTAVMELYRAMWQHSLDRQHALWVMACDPKLYKKLKVLFGRALRKIGRRTPYPGADIIPCVMDLRLSERTLQRHLRSRHPLYRHVRRNVAAHFLAAAQAGKRPKQ